jgi:hypothetical protein
MYYFILGTININVLQVIVVVVVVVIIIITKLIPWL